MKTRTVYVRDIPIGGGHPLVLIAGPCVIESEDLTLRTAERIREITDRLGIPFIFKSSYAKDNRSSVDYYYGPGLEEGLRILEKVKAEIGVPVLSDVHYPDEVEAAAEVLDVLQIPAFLCMQTRLGVTVGKAGKPVNIKKGQFLAPEDMHKVVKKMESTGNHQILLTERGNFFGYHNLIVDMRSFRIMRKTGYPVVFDVTHTVRRYGIPSADPRGGSPEHVPALTRAGVAAGIDALFIETHPDPPSALSDASSMWPLDQLEPLLQVAKAIDELVRQYTPQDEEDS